MKKSLRLASSVAAALALALLALLAPTPALAEHLTGASNWYVTYQDGAMHDNYNAQEYIDQVSGLQPGDDITFTVELRQQTAGSADWYFANDVIKSLEEEANNSNATGSAYEYLLTYDGPAGSTNSRVLYESHAVGGDDSAGLNNATSGLEDFLFLDTLSEGQTGRVTLVVSLDGETEQNAYFDTLARLKLRFAVEPRTSDQVTTTRTNRNVVQTGEQERLFPFYVAMVVSGVALGGLAVWGVVERRRDREEDAR